MSISGRGKRAGRGRVEHDTLGERRVPDGVYYGIQTLRATENFQISALRASPAFIRATAVVKLACCRANAALGLLDKKRARAIERAAEEIAAGELAGEFVVDVYQAGAGTSHNMNANEVIANRAIELMGGRLGDYSVVHPNDHVNMSQSTNDTFPTAMRVAMLSTLPGLLGALRGLRDALRARSRSLDGYIKSARTHLQDAVPIRLGAEFAAYASSMAASLERLRAASSGLKRIGLGATAAGTGINTHPRYRASVLRELRRASGLRGLRRAPDYLEAINSAADFSFYSASLRDLATELIRIANDLRLMSSGPRTGLAEISLPAVQPGSSIMPGKVNPVMAEMLDMVCFQVMGYDLATAAASQAGQLDLNVMFPLINHNILESTSILTSAVEAFTSRCVNGIRADGARCKRYFEASAGLATALNPIIGYEAAAEVAREAAEGRKTIREVAIGRGIMSPEEWERLMRPGRITAPVDTTRGRSRKKKGSTG